MPRTILLAASVVLFAACSRTPSEPPAAERAASPGPDTPASASAMAAVGDASASHAGHASFGVAPGSSVGPGVSPGPADVAYDAPKTWTRVPTPSGFRKATFRIPKAPGDAEDAELAVSAAGGSIEANVERWAGQFGGAKATTTPRQVNGLDVSVVEISGTYAGGGPMMGGGGAPKEHWMLLGAIVKGTDMHHFFKLTGPEKTVKAARADFERFVGTFRAK